MGSLCPFATAGDLLRQVSGLRFSTATVRRVTEGVGAELQAQHARAQAVPPDQPPAWDFAMPDREGQKSAGTVACAGLGAFAVPVRRKGGVGFKRLYVGLLYDPPEGPTLYLVDYDSKRRAGLLRSYGAALGLGKAETVVALTDGGNGPERVLRRGVSEAVACVPDGWHLSEKIHGVGGLVHDADAGAATARAEARETTLWEKGGAALVEEMGLSGCPAGASPEAPAGVVPTAEPCVAERAPDGLPEVPGAWLGRRQRSDGGRLQAGRPAREGGGDALAEGVIAGGGDAEGAVRQRSGLMGGLLETAPTRSRLPYSSTKLNCSPGPRDRHTAGRPAEALVVLGQAVRLRPQAADGHNNRGLAPEALGRYTEAEAAHTEALRLDPASVDAHVNPGNALKAQGRFDDESQVGYQMALWLRRDHPSARHNRALAGIAPCSGRTRRRRPRRRRPSCRWCGRARRRWAGGRAEVTLAGGQPRPGGEGPVTPCAAQLKLYRRPELVAGLGKRRDGKFVEADWPELAKRPPEKGKKEPVSAWGAFTLSGSRR